MVWRAVSEISDLRHIFMRKSGRSDFLCHRRLFRREVVRTWSPRHKAGHETKGKRVTTSMPAWARRSRPYRVRAPSKDVEKHRRSMPRILSAIAGWLLAKTHSGSLRGEGSLPYSKLTACRRGDRVDGGMSAIGTWRPARDLLRQVGQCV
jgi:hypothetical protein